MPTGLTGRWRVAPAALTLFVAAAWVAASVMWGSSSRSFSLPLDPLVQQAGSYKFLRIPAPDRTLDIARVRLIADGVETSPLLDELIPSPVEFERRYPNGAVLVTAFGEPGNTEVTTRRFGWPIAWRTTTATRRLDELKVRRDESDHKYAPNPLTYAQLRIWYGTPTDGTARNVMWNLGPPAFCVLLVMMTYPVLRFVQARWGRRRGRKLRFAARGTALAAVLVALLVVTSSGGKTTSLSNLWVQFSAGARPSARFDEWATVTEADVVSLVQEQADESRVAEVILDHLRRTPNPSWVLHAALIHPMDIENRLDTASVYGPLPLFASSRSDIVRVSDSGEVEPAFRGPRDLVEWHTNWVYLHVPTGRSSDVTFRVNWGGVSICLVVLWVIWMGVRRFCRVCLGARTARRSRRRLCVCCAYPVPS